MKKIIFVLLLLVPMYIPLFAQSAFPIIGGDVSCAGGSLSYTVGQVVVSYGQEKATNAEVKTASLTEGVQQTYSVERLGIDKAWGLGIAVNVHPNPATDKVSVLFEASVDNLRLELYTVDGRLLHQESVHGMEQTIDMRGLSSGSYLLRVADGEKENCYRIIKIK